MATLHDSVLAHLGPRIITGDIEVGATITLESLSEAYGVSRTVAREVVQVLVSMRLVESRRRTGIRVRPQVSWDAYDPAVIRWRLAGPARAEHLYQLSQLRAAVEPEAAALAAVHATEEQRRHLVSTAEQLEVTGAAGDLASFLELDIDFHSTMLHASGNVMFARLAEVVEEVLRGRTDHSLMPPQPKPEARRLHQMVAQAVATGQPAVARAAMSTICVEVVATMRPRS